MDALDELVLDGYTAQGRRSCGVRSAVRYASLTRVRKEAFGLKQL